jgi:hypothetical protein
MRKAGLMIAGLAAAVTVPAGVVLADRNPAEEAKAAAAKEEKRRDRQAKAMFDPDALERGAKSLREINTSPHAKQVRGGEEGVECRLRCRLMASRRSPCHLCYLQTACKAA